MKAFEFLEEQTKELFGDYGDSLGEFVPVNDAYWACKLFAVEQLDSLLYMIQGNSIEGLYSCIEQRIKQLKSKKIKINES